MQKTLQDAMSAYVQSRGMSVQDVAAYPSSGKIVAGLRLARVGSSANGDWIYLSATPQVDPETQTLQFANVTVAGSLDNGSPLTGVAADPALTQALQQVRLSLQDKLQTLTTSANARLSRPLGDGFRSEGRLTDIGLSQVRLLADGVRVDVRASGKLNILYGL
jgi:hypothetical protein